MLHDERACCVLWIIANIIILCLHSYFMRLSSSSCKQTGWGFFRLLLLRFFNLRLQFFETMISRRNSNYLLIHGPRCVKDVIALHLVLSLYEYYSGRLLSCCYCNKNPKQIKRAIFCLIWQFSGNCVYFWLVSVQRKNQWGRDAPSENLANFTHVSIY